jgi:hypothetical protein
MQRVFALLLFMSACQSSAARTDPGHADGEALGASRVQAGPIDGEFAGATFHVAYYEQPSGPPLIGLDYGAYDAAGGGNWLHVALFARGALPRAIDLASYASAGPDGELERARVEIEAARADPGASGRAARARAGQLELDAQRKHFSVAFSDLVFVAAAAGTALPASGRAEGDVAYQCWRYAAPLPSPGPRAVGRNLLALPNPDQRDPRYTEDRDMSSDFCRKVVP